MLHSLFSLPPTTYILMSFVRHSWQPMAEALSWATNFVELEVNVPRTIGILRDADEKSGTMLFKALGTSFVLRDNQALCRLTAKPKANVRS